MLITPYIVNQSCISMNVHMWGRLDELRVYVYMYQTEGWVSFNHVICM